MWLSDKDSVNNFCWPLLSITSFFQYSLLYQPIANILVSIFQSPCQRAFINGKMYKNWCLNTKHQKFRKIKILFKIPVLWHQKYTVHVYLAKKTSDSWIPKTPDQLMSIMHANTISSHSIYYWKTHANLPTHLEINTIFMPAPCFSKLSPCKNSYEPLSRL